jgi:hypothetical protein
MRPRIYFRQVPTHSKQQTHGADRKLFLLPNSVCRRSKKPRCSALLMASANQSNAGCLKIPIIRKGGLKCTPINGVLSGSAAANVYLRILPSSQNVACLLPCWSAAHGHERKRRIRHLRSFLLWVQSMDLFISTRCDRSGLGAKSTKLRRAT